MKKHLLKICTVVSVLSLTPGMFAQWTQKSVSVDKTVDAPVVDGIVDAVWADVDAQAIDQVWKPGDAGEESVSFGDLGATFKALWDDTNIYILVEVDDDNHWNHMDAEVNSWQADKPEIYFDVNDILVDGLGPSVGGSGHHQFAPSFDQSEPRDNHESVFLVEATGPYVYEYAIPFETLLDKDGVELDPLSRTTIGFDISILDLDEPGSGAGNEAGMGRINWCNDVLSTVEGGRADESWTCLDQAGGFIFSSFDVNREEPYAKAGDDQHVIEGQQVNLDGTASFDNQDGSISHFEWTGPEGITIIDSDKALAYFIAPDVKQETTFSFSLTVQDATLRTDTDLVSIKVSRINNRPVANAGEDKIYSVGDMIILDGTASTDEDDDELIYRWESLSNLTLPVTNTDKVQFIAPEVNKTTSYQFVLSVFDMEATSPNDTVTITIEKSSLALNKVSTGKLIIHPNPSRDIATLYLEAMANPTVQVVSIDGRLVEEIKPGDSGVEEIRLDVTNYQTGIYLVVVTGSDQVYTGQLLVK